jgi:hypothetical protein
MPLSVEGIRAASPSKPDHLTQRSHKPGQAEEEFDWQLRAQCDRLLLAQAVWKRPRILLPWEQTGLKL